MTALVRLSIAGLAGLVLAACEPPAQEKPVGAAVVVPPPRDEPLPPAVDATVKRLLEIAGKGDYRDMAMLANETPDFRSNAAGMTHSEYWYLKLRAGDVPMTQIQRVLRYRPAIRDSDQGRVFIWPALALTAPEDITPPLARAIDDLLGPGQAEALKAGGIWPGYVLGVREDGTWLYFISGAG